MRPTAQATVTAGERIHTLDILRGFALLGMIIVHFHQRVHTEASGVEGVIGWIVWIGIEAKAWGIFAFLFGVGFAVLLRRMAARRAPFVAFYLRRLLGLALFGLTAEALFGFHVLLDYAKWGVALLLLHRLSTRTLLAVAAAAAIAVPVLSAGATLDLWPPLDSNARQTTGAEIAAIVDAAQQRGDYMALVRARLHHMHFKYFHLTAVVPGATLTLFILGLLALRHGLFDDPRRHRRVILIGSVSGLAAWAVYWGVLFRLPEFPLLDRQLRYGFGVLNEQWLSLTFVGAVILLLEYRPAWRRRFEWIGLAGRMALTNYMLQVAVLDFVVSGYGLSLKLRPVLGMTAAAALFGSEMLLSRWWLSRYRFGPCEWVWRSITYGRRQPMRRMEEVRLASAGGPVG